MFVKDETLYNALYCGMCKSIGKGCGAMAKTALTYDMAFLSALLHNIADCDVKISKKRCALHPFKRRGMAEPDAISVAIGCINTALAYYKLLDDKRDGDKKGLFAWLYKRGYKRAIKKHPALGEIIKKYTDMQSGLEKQGCKIIDEASEPTALMVEELSAYILKERSTECTRRLCYDIGKWIYLADALDDYDKDVKKGAYNAFCYAFGEKSKAEAVKAHKEEIDFIFNSLFADMRQSLAGVRFYYNHDLTDNIILMGIPLRTRLLVSGKCGEGKKKGVENEQTQS